ncbi:MAG: Wzz/FepE/Etk N-terminal domain-containing protein [Candidatus Azobacteroides sp.]|nr:Wzz/FepE/Etk N-terminal domain-containing protein [Candidatus Azobacteroides sp.]
MHMYNEPVITETEIKEEDNISIKQLFFKYLSYWKWILASLFIFLVLAFIYIKASSPIYEVKSSLLIKDGKSTDNDFISQLNLFSGSKKTDNEVEILSSYTLMERVVKELNLTSRYYIRSGLKNIELYDDSPIRVEILIPDADLFKNNPFKISILSNNEVEINKKKYPVNTPINDFSGSFIVKINDSLLVDWDKNKKINVHLSSLQGATRSLQRDLVVISPPKGQGTVLHLTQYVKVPQMGVDILTNLLREYEAANVNDKNIVASNTLDFIDKRIALLAVDLEDAEETVEQFKKKK